MNRTEEELTQTARVLGLTTKFECLVEAGHEASMEMSDSPDDDENLDAWVDAIMDLGMATLDRDRAVLCCSRNHYDVIVEGRFVITALDAPNWQSQTYFNPRGRDVVEAVNAMLIHLDKGPEYIPHYNIEGLAIDRDAGTIEVSLGS